MSWIRSSLLTGVQSIFGGQSGAHESRLQSALEDIREAMLEGLSVPGAASASKLELKVTYATDLNDLWYLRGDVMQPLLRSTEKSLPGASWIRSVECSKDSCPSPLPRAVAVCAFDPAG